jgi:hypothetical protein
VAILSMELKVIALLKISATVPIKQEQYVTLVMMVIT